MVGGDNEKRLDRRDQAARTFYSAAEASTTGIGRVAVRRDQRFPEDTEEKA